MCMHVPLERRCTACGHRGSIAVADVHEALGTSVRRRRTVACGLRRRWVDAGVAPLPCPGPGCRARYRPLCAPLLLGQSPCLFVLAEKAHRRGAAAVPGADCGARH